MGMGVGVMPDMNTRITVTNKVEVQHTHASDLKLGSWVEIKAANSNSYKRAKLKWISKGDDKFIFVDQRGHKIRQLSEDELDRNLASGKIKVLNAPGSASKSKARLGQGFDYF